MKALIGSISTLNVHSYLFGAHAVLQMFNHVESLVGIVAVDKQRHLVHHLQGEGGVGGGSVGAGGLWRVAENKRVCGAERKGQGGVGMGG